VQLIGTLALEPRTRATPAPALPSSATANTVPVNCAIVGVEDELSVAVAHAGGPDVNACGETGAQPLPVHQYRMVPPPRLQSEISRLEKLLPNATRTSKYWPPEANDGCTTGLDAYCASVNAPSPTAVTVVPAFVAVAVPAGLLELALTELTEPRGAGGGVMLVGGGVVLVGVVLVGGDVVLELIPNDAVTAWSPFIVTVHGPVPEQPPPDQPSNMEPAAGVAVSVTPLPGENEAEQVPGHEIPAGELVTVPEPEPVTDTLSEGDVLPPSTAIPTTFTPWLSTMKDWFTPEPLRFALPILWFPLFAQ
jgi:hypothetical protein